MAKQFLLLKKYSYLGVSVKKKVAFLLCLLIFFIVFTVRAKVSDLHNNLTENHKYLSDGSLNEGQKDLPKTGTTNDIEQKILVTESEQYKKAVKYIEEKHYPQAMGILADLSDYKDAKSLLEQLRYIINGSYISNGIWAVAAITSDGGVRVAYEHKDDSNFSLANSWKNIKSISARGGESIEGLTNEGKVITTSPITKEELLSSKVPANNAMANVVESIFNWSNIKSFQTFYPQSAVALTNEGTVYAAYPYYSDGTVKLKDWENILSVADGRGYVVGIRKDRTVLSNNYDYSGNIDTSQWKNIVAISAGTSVIGLKEDGTVVSTGLNRFGEGNTSHWEDIIAISTRGSCTLGLKRNGTVVAAGTNTYGQMDVENWTDIVAIAAGEYFSIGLKSDGTMVLAGDCGHSGAKTPDLSGMKGLYVPQISKQK